MAFGPERLAYWYLRLNGFLTIENFVVHPDTGFNQRTDADLIGVRFAYRKELEPRSMRDDRRLLVAGPYVNVILAEVKRGQCALNGPWTDKNKQNVQRVLRAIGCLEPGELRQAAVAIYELGAYYCQHAAVRLMAFGDSINNTLPIPIDQQVLFNDMISFFYSRLKEFDRQKRSVGNWPLDGQAIRDAYDKCRNDETEFCRRVRSKFNLEEPAVRGDAE